MSKLPLVRWAGVVFALVAVCTGAFAQGTSSEVDEGYLTKDKNWIAGLKVNRYATGISLEFDVHYTGQPAGATVQLRQPNMQDVFKGLALYAAAKPADRGFIHMSMPIAPTTGDEAVLVVELKTDKQLLATRTLKTRIQWPTPEEMKAMQGEAPTTPNLPVTDRNLIANMAVKPQPDGTWLLTFDYFYTGEPQGATFDILRADGKEGEQVPSERSSGESAPAYKGANRFSGRIDRPNDDKLNVTMSLIAEMRGADHRVLLAPTLPTRIEWPSRHAMDMQRELAYFTPEQIVSRAVTLIDTNERDSVDKAKEYLERAIELDPRTDSAYIEMARVSMALNWGPEGLAQAEQFLDTALQIRDTTNARILLGYVYAHQKKYIQAEALLSNAARRNPANLWLWANWGELEEMQGHADKAIAHYRESLARPHTANTYDRARVFSFDKLFTLLEARKDYDTMEAVHKQRVEEYGSRDCHGVEYARFLIDHRADAAGAIALARRATEGRCDRDTVRETLAIAHYLAWSRDKQRTDSLSQARLYLPVGAKLFYELARSDATADVARQLIASGEKVDMKDNQNLNALAYAFNEKEAEVAARLLKLGAKPDTPVGTEGVPVAFVPAYMKDIPSIRLLQRMGVDYAKLRHKGVTMIEMARRAGQADLVEVLERPGA